MFVRLPIVRGFENARVLFELAQKHEATICGGYARYCCSPLKDWKVIKPSDCDIFGKTEAACKEIVVALERLGYAVRHENAVSITMATANLELQHIPTPQIIKPVEQGHIVTAGTTEEILSNFDFSITRAAIISETECLVDELFEEDEKNGRLRLMNIHCPVSSLIRCCKYARKGYWLPPIEAIKLFRDWDDRTDEYRGRLIELFKESEGEEKLSQEDIDELEALLRID